MGTRLIHPATLAAISSGAHNPIILVFLDWPEGAVRMHSNVGNVSFGGYTWLGAGNFGSLSVPGEGGGLAQTVAEMKLIGAPQELDDYLESPIRGRLGQVLYGCVTERGGNVLIGEPFDIFTGFMDSMLNTLEALDNAIARAIAITVADGPSQRLSASLSHTDEDQRRTHPDDTAGRLTLFAEKRNRDLTWPA